MGKAGRALLWYLSVWFVLFLHGFKSMEAVTLRSHKQHEMPTLGPQGWALSCPGPCFTHSHGGAGDMGLPSPAPPAPDPPQVMLSSKALEHGKEGFMWGSTALRDAPGAGVAFILAGFLFAPLPLFSPLGDLSRVAPAPLQGKTVLPPRSSQRAQESCRWCHFEEKAYGGGSRVNPTWDSTGRNSAEVAHLGPRQLGGIPLPAPIPLPARG